MDCHIFPSYVLSNYPYFNVLLLTVTCRNKAAYHCYSKCSLDDTGDLYLGVPTGRQHIMQINIA